MWVSGGVGSDNHSGSSRLSPGALALAKKETERSLTALLYVCFRGGHSQLMVSTCSISGGGGGIKKHTYLPGSHAVETERHLRHFR